MEETRSPYGTDSSEDEDEEFWPPPRRRAREERAQRARRTWIIAVAGAAAFVLLAAVVIVVMWVGGDDSEPDARPLPTSYVATPANPQLVKLDLRSGDQRPLTEREVFGEDVKSVSHGPLTFKLMASKLDDNCLDATWGDRLKNDLRAGTCSQLIRGLYVSEDKKYTGMITTFNLDRKDGAEQILRDLDPQNGAGFVQPLESKQVKNFGEGFSAAYAQPFGHYLVLTWVQRTGGAKPDTLTEMTNASVAVERAANFVWQRLVLAGG